MPTVPYASVPRVSPQPLQAPRLSVPTSAETFGGGVASDAGGLGDLSGAINATERIAQEQQRIRLEEKARADQIAVTFAGSQLSDYKNHTLYDPQEGALNQHGQNAFGLPESVAQNYRDVTNVIRDGLGNDDQKAVFDRLAASEWNSVNEQVQRHVAGERQKFDTDTTNAFLTNKRNEALSGYADPMAVESSIDYQRAALQDHGKRNGLSSDVINEQVAKATSATRFGVVEAMLNNEQDLSASAYFAAHREDFVGTDLLRAEKLTEAGSIRAASQSAADGIVTRTQSLTEAVKQAQEIQDPRVRDATEQRVRRHFEDQAADLRQDRAQAFQSASAILEQTGDFNKIPLSARVKLSPEENEALQRREDQIRHPKTRTDWDTYNSLMNMAGISDVSRQQFLETDLSKYRGTLADPEFKQLLGMQRTLREKVAGAISSEAKRQGAASDKAAQKAADRDAARQTLESMGIKLPPTVPGAPLPTKAGAPGAPGASTASPAATSSVTAPNGMKVPQAWLDHAARDPNYKAYLQHMGIKVP